MSKIEQLQQENQELKNRIKVLEDSLTIKKSKNIDKKEIINKIINEKLLENSDATTYELLLKQLVKFSFDKNNEDSFRLLAIDKLLKELKEVDKEGKEDLYTGIL